MVDPGLAWHLETVGPRVLGEERVVNENAPATRQDEIQPQIVDLGHVPLDQLPAESECSDIVSRILGKRGFTPRIDVAAFDSAI